MIKFLDISLVNKRFEIEFKNAFSDFLNTGQYILGKQVECFENEFAHYCDTKYCIGVSSGLDALQLIFQAYKELGILKNNDEVIVPANTYIASALAISNSGLKPVLVEPDIRTFNIDPEKILAAINSKTKAILGVHLYGRVYDFNQLEKISKKYNLILIEDAAQAHGAQCSNGLKAGNLSNAAAFSFYPTKNLGALGDAGAITTSNIDLASTIFKLRNYGTVSTYSNELKGFNNRLDELQASFLRIKLKNLDKENDKRREIAKFYIENITSKNIILPSIKDFREHTYHLFVIRTKRRDDLKRYLYQNGVETLIHYPIPIHKQLAYQEEYLHCVLPITEQIHNEVLSLPLNTTLTKNQIRKIVSLINLF